MTRFVQSPEIKKSHLPSSRMPTRQPRYAPARSKPLISLSE